MKKNIWFLALSLFHLAAAPAHDTTFTADYVIIGSGPAGAPIAKLLTDDKKASVILLEAGSNYNKNPLINLSENIVDVVFTDSAQFSWLQETVPQPFIDNRSVGWTTGRLLGGASSINGTFWIRGSNQLFSQWEQFGGKKWTLDRINRVFKYLEHYEGQTPNPPYRGFHGPVHVRQPTETTPTGVKFATAIQEATGAPILLDYNDPATPIGTDTRVQWTQRGPVGKFRVSSATAFLNHHVMTSSGKGVHGRKLRVLTKTTALKTIWDGNTAIGVEALRAGKSIKVFAKKKVIVCAGTSSSQFLLLSGIGPKKVLEGLKIPVVCNNPNVGVGVQDQAAVIALWSTNPNDPATPPGDPNDIASFLSFLPDPSGGNPNTRSIQLVGRILTPGVVTVGVILCNEKSSGSVQLQSTDPLQMPRVDLGLLSNNDDLETLKSAFRNYILPIADALAIIDPDYQLIAPTDVVINDDALLTTYIQSNVDLPTSVHNYTTHCRMGSAKHGGVVDGKGHVYGVKNLIVADCSIAPTTTDGACQAMGYMIGANIAFQILEEEKVTNLTKALAQQKKS